MTDRRSVVGRHAARRIVAAAEHLLADPSAHARMRAAQNPFGDGAAAPRIAARLEGGLATRVSLS